MLTVKELSALTPKDDGRRLSDGGSLFGKVRLNRSGAVSVFFTYRFRFAGKVRDIRCGTWPKDTLKEIRHSRDASAASVHAGVDPGALRRTEKALTRTSRDQLVAESTQEDSRPTVSALFDRWHRFEASRRRDGGGEVRRMFEKDVLPRIGDRIAEDVRRAEIAALLDAVLERGARIVANHLLGDLRQMYGFAITRGIFDHDPTSRLRKADFGGRANERDRTLSVAEIRELSEKLPSAHLLRSTEYAIWIMLSTCCRIGELIRARWSDVDFDNRSWIIPASNAKNGKPLTVFLSDFTFTQLNLLREQSISADWLFPKSDGKTHLDTKAISKQLRDRQRSSPLRNRSRDTESLTLSGGNWTPHDLRRTGATLMGDLGVRPDVIERCLNHVDPNRVKRIYQRQKLAAEQAEAWQLLGHHILEITQAHTDFDACRRTGRSDDFVPTEVKTTLPGKK